MNRPFTYIMLLCALQVSSVEAGVLAKPIQDAAKSALKKMGRDAGSETIETLTQSRSSGEQKIWLP